jgi:hypothetical protein
MEVFLPITAGLAATLVMSVFTTLTWMFFNQPYRVVWTLAILFRYGRHATIESPGPFFYGLGIVVHYAIGIGFAFCYLGLIREGILELSLMHALLFGVLLGVIAIVGWRIFLAMHKDPLPYNLLVYLGVIGVGHIPLGLVMFYIYNSFLPLREVAEGIPVC